MSLGLDDIIPFADEAEDNGNNGELMMNRDNDFKGIISMSPQESDGITIKPMLTASELVPRYIPKHLEQKVTTDRNDVEFTGDGDNSRVSLLLPTNDKRNVSKRKRCATLRKWLLCRCVNYDEVTEPDNITDQSEPNTQDESGVVKIDTILDAFLHYNHESRDPARPHGRGLCVIFPLFTGDLPGYFTDRNRAFRFFHGELHYDVYCDKTFENLSKHQLMQRIDKIKNVIKTKAQKNGQPYYDRLAVIILTHGTKDGLLTCADSGGVLEEKYYDINDEQQQVLTTVDEVVAKFKHNEVLELKGKPKMFLIQSCRGSSAVRAAGADEELLLPEYDLNNLSLRPEVPIDADILVFYAATPDNESYVSRTQGSWFIQKTLDVFEKHYKQRHVDEMMTLINFVVSEERAAAKTNAGNTYQAVQMPCKFSTLRMNFYL